MSDAVKPNFFTNLDVVEDKQIDATQASEEEKALATLSRTKGWKILNLFIESQSRGLDKLNFEAVKSGASLEEIGRNTVVIAMAKGVISQIQNKVADAVDAVEDNGNE